jgi:hypothetical protein
MSEQTSEQVQSEKQDSKTAPEQTVEKKEYKKPELRKYTQIDYVTAYGVD